jgi:hypothetical protein
MRPVTEITFEVHMNKFMLFAGIWWLSAIALACLLLYRKHLEQYEDDFLHLANPEPQLIGGQAEMSHKLDVLDRWVRVLVAVVVVYGACMAAVYLFGIWENRP